MTEAQFVVAKKVGYEVVRLLQTMQYRAPRKEMYKSPDETYSMFIMKTTICSNWIQYTHNQYIVADSFTSRLL